MNYHHLAHFDELIVKKGDRVKRGQLIGYMGTTGASTAPHTHYEIMNRKPSSWTIYTQGLSREDVARLYVDPKRYIDSDANIPVRYDRFTGYGFLDTTETGLIHPGEDLNFGDDGWADYRAPVLAPVDGEVVFDDHDGSNGGWGDHLWIEESDNSLNIDMDFAKSLARQKWGFYIQVEQRGELWAVNEAGERTYIHPDNFMDFIRSIAVGISDDDLNKVPIKD